MQTLKEEPGIFRLAFSATLHCLLGCGLGEIAGMITGTALLLSNHSTMILAIIFGFVGGFALGIIPLKKAGYTWKAAFKQVLIAEGLSIAVMETFEVLVQIYTPGVMEAGLSDGIFWLGMLLGLAAGFIAAFPVNYIFVKKGFRHIH
ncbi:MAG: DUF4396 domain-containing protein [Ignavibacteria bacterium]|nr:DUF4396 domain-containing protein [Ignavibacteria bacterium]